MHSYVFTPTIMRKQKLYIFLWRCCLFIITTLVVRQGYSVIVDQLKSSDDNVAAKHIFQYDKIVARPRPTDNYKRRFKDLNKHNNFHNNFLKNKIKIQAKQKVSEEIFWEKVDESHFGITKDPLNLDKIQICVEGMADCMDPTEYKKYKSMEYTKLFANPYNISNIPPTLRTYGIDQGRPDPLIMVQDTTQKYDNVLINQELENEKKRRMVLGDNDLLQIKEVQDILMQRTKYKIPNIMHFIWFGCRQYRTYHYSSMISALRYQRPSLILFHTNCTPISTHWDRFRNAAGNKLKIVKRSPPLEIFGNKIFKVEHQSDLARLHILLEVGGMYLDDDVIVLKSLDDLRFSEMVLGEENYDALANSVIMASSESWFLHRWFQEYRRFNGSKWSDSSCFVPWAMWRLFPDTINVVKEKMLRPNWEEIDYLYRGLWNWRNSYTIHLYSRFMEAVDGTNERTFPELCVLNTTFGEISRHAIWGDSNFQDVSRFLFDF